MIDFVDLVERIRSGVVRISFMDENNIELGSGTGFLSNGYLVTNDHVWKCVCSEQCKEVWIGYHNTQVGDNASTNSPDKFVKATFKLAAPPSSENSYDYAIIKLPKKIIEKSLYNFELQDRDSIKIGTEVAFLGYPFSKYNITCHKGFISSVYRNGIVNVIQVDASVNGGNSGGPLFLPETGEVIGIITRKEDGIMQAFNELKNSLEDNAKKFAQSKGGISMGFDIAEAFEIIQHQIQRVVMQLERSANVGIGYAFAINPIIDEINNLTEDAKAA